MSIRWSIQIKKNRQRLYLYTHISYISYTYPIHITLVVPSRQCLFTYLTRFNSLRPSDACMRQLTDYHYTAAQRSWRGGILDSPCPSVRPSVHPSVCRRHGFWSISQVCFGISLSNFICMLMVVKGRSLLIFRDITFKMAAWQPYWIFGFPDFNFTLALNINSKLQRHNTYVYG